VFTSAPIVSTTTSLSIQQTKNSDPNFPENPKHCKNTGKMRGFIFGVGVKKATGEVAFVGDCVGLWWWLLR
jgi:hypothetical protein